MKPLRVAFCGFGHKGQAHFRTAATRTDVQMVGFFDPAADAQGTDGLPRFASAQELLSAGVDVAVIAAPPDAHAALALLAFRFGAHVFCEKPFGCSAAETLAITTAARAADRSLGGGLNVRGLAAVRGLHALAATGALGEIDTVYARWTRSAVLPGAQPYPPLWYRDRRVTGGGVLRDLGVHLLDAALHLTGYRTGRVDGFSVGSNRLTRAMGGSTVPPLDVEDTVTAIFAYHGGPSVNLHCSWLEQADGQEDFELRLVGTAGSASARGRAGKAALELTIASQTAPPAVLAHSTDLAPLTEYLDELGGGGEPKRLLEELPRLAVVLGGLESCLQSRASFGAVLS